MSSIRTKAFFPLNDDTPSSSPKPKLASRKSPVSKPGKILEIVLSAIALTVVVSIFIKAIVDVDGNYDVGWYHLPFAARIWGIVPESSFLSEDLIEYRYAGFPLLAHFFQGLLWKLTGRIQATNLVGYLSLIIYFLFLRGYFRVPLYLTAIAIFTIPAVLTHASISLVDLPGNVAVSVVMMMTYHFFRQSKLPRKDELLITFLGAAAAVNTKPQLQPLIFLLYWIVGGRLLWLYFKHTTFIKRQLWLTISLSIIASILIFATPIKNVVAYGNPFYPIKIEVAGMVLNHKLTPETYGEGNRPQKWLQSVLEINTPPWSADQWNGGDNQYLDRAGGFFGLYVVFNLMLLLGLTIRERLSFARSGNAITALLTILLVSLVPANFPQSHELRYFMFWMITLVSLNLSVIAAENESSSPWRDYLKWLQPKYLGLVYLLFMAIAFIKIDSYYLRPVFNALPPYIEQAVNSELLAQVRPNELTCMISRHAVIDPQAVPYASIANAFFYSAYFHPEIAYDYSIKAAVNPQNCNKLNLPMIPASAKKSIQAK